MQLNHCPAKVLLLGEYTILSGSKALALPFDKFNGHWSFEDNNSEARTQSQESLMAFLNHDSAHVIDRSRLVDDLKRGLWFDSSIPQGYGLGSSGALIAAVFSTYGQVSGDLHKDKRALADLENYFHGASSGLDPLVSLIKKPLLIHDFAEVEVLEKKLDLSGFFLLNTGKPRQTGPLVNIYQEKMKDPQFKRGCAEQLVQDVNLAIAALVNGETKNLFHNIWHISKFQWEYFPEMIPTQMRGIWTRGLETGDYVLKLCGAGGGGFLLGHSEKYDLQGMQSIIDTHELRTFT